MVGISLGRTFEHWSQNLLERLVLAPHRRQYIGLVSPLESGRVNEAIPVELHGI